MQKSCKPVTLTTLQDGGAFAVVHQADGTRQEAGARSTLRVVLLPLTPEAWGGGTTLGAGHTPAGWTPEGISESFIKKVEFNKSQPAANISKIFL